MDFVSREEFDAVKTMAGKAREEAEDEGASRRKPSPVDAPAARVPVTAGGSLDGELLYD